MSSLNVVLSRRIVTLLRDVRLTESFCVAVARKPIRHLRHYRAAVLKEFGQKLVIEDLKPIAKLQKDEVRIKVHCCGVNNSDALTVSGEYKEAIPKLPFVPGFEVSGEIQEVGSGVTELKTGDRVVAVNKQRREGFAEECIALTRDVWKLPSSIDYVKGASLIDCYATAYLGLVRRAQIEPENTILVTAAAGGLGLAAVDLAANTFHAKVIGVCGTEDKASLVREKGAWSALAYDKKGMAKKIKEVTDGKGVDVVFDAVGGELFLECLNCVAHEGKVIVAGFASRKIPTLPTDLLLPKAFSLTGISLSHYRDANTEVYRSLVDDVIEMCSDGDVDPYVSETFRLEQINDALQFVLERKSTGKVVLQIS